MNYAFNFTGKLKMYITHTPHRENNFTGKHNFTHTHLLYRQDNFTGKLRGSSNNRGRHFSGNILATFAFCYT